MNIDEMDQLIAKEILGWEWTKPRHGSCCTCQRCGRANEDAGDPCYNFSCEMTEEVSSAWKIIEKMDDMGFMPQLFKTLNTLESIWECDFMFDQCIVGTGQSKNPAMAICLAAVDYLQGWKKEQEEIYGNKN